MRLIDADKLIEVFSEKKEVWRGNGVLPSNESLMWLAAMGITSNAPTVDAAPVKHGRWKGYSVPHWTKRYDDNGDPEYKNHNEYVCSICSRKTIVKEKFCPTCGAKMDLEEQKCTSTDTEP